jgi:hypothetical protein
LQDECLTVVIPIVEELIEYFRNLTAVKMALNSLSEANYHIFYPVVQWHHTLGQKLPFKYAQSLLTDQQWMLAQYSFLRFITGEEALTKRWAVQLFAAQAYYKTAELVALDMATKQLGSTKK